MISDIICENLVKKKWDTAQIIKIIAVFGGGTLVSYFLLLIGSVNDPSGMLAPMLFMVGLFLTVFFGRYFLTVEYEYAFFNGEITFDKISAKSKRKHLIDVDLKAVEKMGCANDEAISHLKVTKVRDYSASKTDENTIYIYFKDEKSGDNTLLFFTPNQKMLDAMKTSVSATVYREYYSKTKKN